MVAIAQDFSAVATAVRSTRGAGSTPAHRQRQRQTPHVLQRHGAGAAGASASPYSNPVDLASPMKFNPR